MASVVKCSPGNKPCGKRCIPDDQTCRIGANSLESKEKKSKYLRIGAMLGVSLAVMLIANESKKQYVISGKEGIEDPESYRKSAAIMAGAATIVGGALFFDAVLGSLDLSPIVRYSRKKLLKDKLAKEAMDHIKGTDVEKGLKEVEEEAKSLPKDKMLTMGIPDTFDDNIGWLLSAQLKENLGPTFSVIWKKEGEKRGIYVSKKTALKQILTTLQIGVVPVNFNINEITTKESAEAYELNEDMIF